MVSHDPFKGISRHYVIAPNVSIFLSSSCWLKNDIAFYVAVVAYFCVIFVLNLVMFVVVMVHLRRIKRRNPHNNQYRSGLHDLRSIAGLTFLLGLTWGFAFFAWGPVNLAFMYLFAILNSLQGEKSVWVLFHAKSKKIKNQCNNSTTLIAQFKKGLFSCSHSLSGFFIFVFHCALKENVRKQWRMYLCCGSLRLAENSGTATLLTKLKNSCMLPFNRYFIGFSSQSLKCFIHRVESDSHTEQPH